MILRNLFPGFPRRREPPGGLARSRCGIVVIDPNFLRQEWPQKGFASSCFARTNVRFSITLLSAFMEQAVLRANRILGWDCSDRGRRVCG